MADQALRLTALQARNPLGFLAAVGTLEVAARFFPKARLYWAGSLNPRAVLSGLSQEEMHSAVSRDQDDVASSPILSWPPMVPTPRPKISKSELSEWAAAIQSHVVADPDRDWVSDLWCGVRQRVRTGQQADQQAHPLPFHCRSAEVSVDGARTGANARRAVRRGVVRAVEDGLADPCSRLRQPGRASICSARVTQPAKSLEFLERTGLHSAAWRCTPRPHLVVGSGPERVIGRGRNRSFAGRCGRSRCHAG